MTVAELIRELESMSQDAEVWMNIHGNVRYLKAVDTDIDGDAVLIG